MGFRKRSRDEHFANDGQPKRILALDGGGLRGIFTVGVLQRIETLLRDRHGGDPEFRLCDYFDLIAGTSTGAIIAAALAAGWKADDIKSQYDTLGKKVFESDILSGWGVLRAKYDESKLIAELKTIYGDNTLLGGPELHTGLMIMTKRIDSGSPWPIGNNPRGKYFADRPNGVIGNGAYPLWQVVRASTAAPTFFDSQMLTIATASGKKDVTGEFIDGGVSPFNNPSLQALMYATLDGYRIGWPTGADRLMLVSLGTGMADPVVKHSAITVKQGIGALGNLMEDSAVLQETLLQWMSTSPTARVFDREIGDLKNDLLAPAPLITYLRYNAQFTREGMEGLDPALTDTKQLEDLSKMDVPENMPALHRLGTLLAARDIKAEHFPSRFDLSA